VSPGASDGAVLINRINDTPVWTDKFRYDVTNNIWVFNSSINMSGKSIQNVNINANDIISSTITSNDYLTVNLIKPITDASGISVYDTYSVKQFLFDTSEGIFHAKTNIISKSNTLASDIRIKENIKPIEDSNADIIEKFNVVEFNYIGDNKSNYGLIAQEVESLDSNLVATSEFNMFDETITDFKSINYNEIIALLIKHNQILSKRVTELETIIKSNK
jgi:hypothetical protein